MYIEDGQTGYKAKVNSDNQLTTKAVIVRAQQQANHANGDCYSVVVSKTPTAAGDCFLYIKNSDDKDLIVTSLRLHAATDEIVQVKLGDSGTPVGGTANTPVNRNAGSGHTADVTSQDGVDITGLSGGATVDQIAIDGAVGAAKTSWCSGLVIPKNQTVSLYAVTGGIAVKATLSMYFNGV